MQASKTKRLQLIPKDTRKPGLKRQKANTILQIELQHTELQLMIPSWYDSNSNHQKECSKSELIQLYFPTSYMRNISDFFPLQISQVNNLSYIYELEK